ncbi:MAG: type II toxin-antitoxin system VapC family toxin [Verrucomicrobiales bacterium]|nr:type II toxin-antitoxin system VapC family toxin [Verrucomicrobiales bacterium]
MNPYADSSFLVSCYIKDANTASANDYLARTRTPLVFTALHALELRNAFELGVFRGLFASADAAAALRDMESDLRGGRLERIAVEWPVALRLSARFSALHSATIGTRSLDILHVAAAKTMRAVGFVSFDNRQRTLAAKVGLKVAP